MYGLNYLTGAAMLTDSSGNPDVNKVYATGGLPSSPSLSINPYGTSSLYIGLSSQTTPEIVEIQSPPKSKILKSWKEKL